MITIIDYGMGNLRSIQNMLKHIDVPSEITSEVSKIENAENIILPGVGAFDTAMANIDNMDIRDILRDKALVEKTPMLGICLGMQLLGKGSQEGKAEGLGLLDAVSKKFDFRKADKKHSVPHMGWNTVNPRHHDSLFQDMAGESRFYFVHSYHVVCENEDDILATTDYGIEFTSAVQRDNIYGVQYHPEKSHRFGMQLLKNFAEMYRYA
ncbi:MAG: imidazole glycerol phosphate synthase subunit HisH [Candidatus Zixiibacteriota bacterium]